MEKELQNIISKAAELSGLIQRHETARAYTRSLAEIRGDRASLDLLNRLTAAGKEIREKADQGEDAVSGRSAEYQMIEDELRGNQLVKDFLLAQRSYLQLMQDVINLIKDPAGETS